MGKRREFEPNAGETVNTRTPTRSFPVRSPRRLPEAFDRPGLTVTEMLRRLAYMDWTLRTLQTFEKPGALEAPEELEVSS